MAHETPKIKAETRERTGSKYAARLRKAGKMPVVIYGHGEGVAHAAVDTDEMVDHILEGAHLIELELEGGSETCLIKEMQFDYLGTNIIHVDLTRVSLDEEVTVDVPVRLLHEDDCKALETPGAILEHPLTSLEVSCKANAIPSEISISIKDLEIGDSITVSDLTLPEGVTTDVVDDTAVAYISIVEEQEEEAPEEAASLEPEVIGEAEEGEAEGEEAAAEAPEESDED